MQVDGVKELKEKLRKLAEGRRGRPGKKTVVVGYTQHYAVYVHENLEANHPVGQAKYLEQPARQLASEFGRMVVAALKKKISLIKALLLVGLRLQRESQKLVPVDTGALKASAFTIVEGQATPQPDTGVHGAI